MRSSKAEGVQTRVGAPSFREAFLYWLKLGFVNFGGPAAQIAMMHRDLVERKKWIGEERFLHALNYCMLLPGPEAQQLAIYVGWLFHRTWGGIVAGVLFVLPSVFIILALAWAYVTYGSVPWVAGALHGLQAVVLGIILHAVLRIGKRGLRGAATLAIAAAAFVALLLGAPFPLVVLGAALVGYAAPGLFPAAGPAADASAERPRGARHAAKILAVGALLWALPMALLLAFPGEERIFLQSALFWSAMALVTFGGAYAVLAYVSQVAVESYGWLSAREMVAGLGLAETTPGPLIMVLAFVGFVAAYHLPGGLPPVVAGTVGGLVATYFTFLFSFLFIFLGAPHVERLRGHAKLASALGAVTAAVVGVILSLAVYFGRHLLLDAGFDAFAALLAATAFVVLAVTRVGVAPVVLAGGLVGLARTLVG